MCAMPAFRLNSSNQQLTLGFLPLKRNIMSSSKATLENHLVDFIHGFDLSRVSDRALENAKLLMQDQLALQIGCSLLPWSKETFAYALTQARPGRSSIVASGKTVDAGTAAFVNAIYGHAFEYDDILSGSSAHPGCCVVPAALALGEECESSVQDVLTAMIVGYEVYTRLGVLAAPTLVEKGWHPHCVLANFGAAAIAARLGRLDRLQTFHAMSIAMSHCSGTTEYTSTGGSIKRVHSGIGVQNGIHAAAMARAGITGPDRFLTGTKGFFQTFIQRPAGEASANAFALEAPLQIEQVWIKPYCCCGANHAPIDAMATWRDRTADIERIEVRVQPKSNRVVGNHNQHIYSPRGITELQYALPVQMALSVLGLGNGYATHRAYLDGKLDFSEAGAILSMARRVKIIEAPEFDNNYIQKWVAEVTAFFKDGTSEKLFIEDSVGTPARPMNQDQFRVKYDELAGEVLGGKHADELFQKLSLLDMSKPVGSLTELTYVSA
jgi:2-methylcitrate dehydratase PrpD